MTQDTRAALLDLDTFVERPFITIDGTAYELRSPGELSVMESHRFGRWGKRIEVLQDADGEEAVAELDELVATAARAILIDVSDELFEKLSGSHRWKIIDVFTGLLLREKLKVAGAMTTAMGPLPAGFGSPTGASSFPASSASTAAVRPTGFITRLLRLFGLS